MPTEIEKKLELYRMKIAALRQATEQLEDQWFDEIKTFIDSNRYSDVCTDEQQDELEEDSK